MKYSNPVTELKIIKEIGKARAKYALSLRGMGEVLDVSHAAVQQWEDGVVQPDTDTLILIAVKAGKAGNLWVRDLALKCLNLRYPELHSMLVLDGKLVEA